jgi:ornithine cyclodeaminase
MNPTILQDSDIMARIRARVAVDWMREAVTLAEQGHLRAPKREWVDFPGEGRIVFTAGALSGDWYGYRSYDTFNTGTAEQVVVIHDAHTGEVRAIAIGVLLGQLRTGALGGVAIDAFAPLLATTLGVIGSGNQAWSQLWAISGVRNLSRVDVYSPNVSHAEAFAARARFELGVDCHVASSAEHATRGHEMVVLATSSATPVIKAEWIDPGAHVNTLGAKQQGAAEFGLDLLERADVVVTDSLSQLTGYDPPTLVEASAYSKEVNSLGRVLIDGAFAARSHSAITLYLSVGLAGTEAYLLNRLCQSES